MNRKQFTFYRSFMDGIKRIKAKAARCEAYDAIIAYALDGTEPDLDKLSDAAALAFVMAKPNLDSARKKAEAGQKGGESKPQAKPKQSESKPQANDKLEIEQDIDIEQMLKESKKKSRTTFQAPTLDEVAAYCRERNNCIDPQRFMACYEKQGWRLSNGNKMTDWKAAVRYWERGTKKPTVETRGKQVYGGDVDPTVARSAYLKLCEELGEDPEATE